MSDIKVEATKIVLENVTAEDAAAAMDKVGKGVSWWKAHKKDFAYMYNSFAGGNGDKAYYIAAGISVGIFIIVCLAVSVLNSISVILLNGGILLLVLNLDNFVKPEYLPWKEHGGHIEYTRFKVSVLEPIKDVRASVYNMVGINEENKPTNNQIFAMIGAGLLLTILIYLIPVRLFTFIVVVGLNTIPRYLRNRNEKKAQKLESERQQIKEELKKQDIYLKKDDRHNLANANKDEVDKELLEKAEKRAALKRQMKEQFAELDLRKKKK